MSPRRAAPRRGFSRMARVNQLLHEIIADELERIDDDRLAMVTVMAVDTESDLRRAVVYVEGGNGTDEDVLAALGEVRARLQRAVASQARTKRTPELRFTFDPVERGAGRVEDILRTLRTDG